MTKTLIIDNFKAKNKDTFHPFVHFLDFQILSIEMHKVLQEEEEPAKGQVDQGFQEERGQGVVRRPFLRVRKEEKRTRQIQQRIVAEDK